jgi:hypothetical protein
LGGTPADAQAPAEDAQHPPDPGRRHRLVQQSAYNMGMMGPPHPQHGPDRKRGGDLRPLAGIDPFRRQWESQRGARSGPEGPLRDPWRLDVRIGSAAENCPSTRAVSAQPGPGSTACPKASCLATPAVPWCAILAVVLSPDSGTDPASPPIALPRVRGANCGRGNGGFRGAGVPWRPDGVQTLRRRSFVFHDLPESSWLLRPVRRRPIGDGGHRSLVGPVPRLWVCRDVHGGRGAGGDR